MKAHDPFRLQAKRNNVASVVRLDLARCAIFGATAVLASCGGGAVQTRPNSFNGNYSNAPVRGTTAGGDWNLVGIASVRYPSAVAVDANGNVFVASFKTNQVSEIRPDGTQVKIGKDFKEPSGVAVFKDDVYVTDTKNAAVKKISPDGTITTVGSGWSEPTGIAADSSGNLYVSDLANETVSKVKRDGKTSEIIGPSACLNPTQIAVDGNRNVYVVCNDKHDVLKINSSGSISEVGSGWTFPLGIAIDRRLNLYVTQKQDGLYELTAHGKLVHIAVNKQVPNVAGVAFRNGSLFVNSYAKGEVYKAIR